MPPPPDPPPPHVVAIIQARMGSSRLPGKVLRRVGQWTVLELLLHRLKGSRAIAECVVATSDAPADDPIEVFCERAGVGLFRGSEDNVLSRYFDAARRFNADVIVRITGDCPFICGAEVDRVVHAYVERAGTAGACDYVTNQAGENRRIPRGLDVEVFSAAALSIAHAAAHDGGDLEHVTPYFYREPGRFRTLVSDPPGPDRGWMRLTVDTPDDLVLVDTIAQALGRDADLEDIAGFLEEHPAVLALNAHVEQRGIQGEAEQRARRVAGLTLLGRADAGPGVGMGHLARMESLLDAWSELGGRAVLYGSGIIGPSRERLETAGAIIVDAGPPGGSGGEPEAARSARDDAADAASTIQLARREGAVAVAADGYHLGPDFQRALAHAAPLIFIDDLAQFHQVAHVVVNQNLGFDPARYSCSEETRLLVGHPYVLLRREWRDAADAPHPAADRRLLVSFGGADLRGLTLPVCEALLPVLPSDTELVVIAGPYVRPDQAAALNNLASCSGTGGARLTILRDVAHMANLFSGAEMAIVAAGSTVWELLACGVPVLALAVAENQRVVCSGLSRRGAGVDLGWYETTSAEAIAAEVIALLEDPKRRSTLARVGRSLIDGRGVWRVIDAILSASRRKG